MQSTIYNAVAYIAKQVGLPNSHLLPDIDPSIQPPDFAKMVTRLTTFTKGKRVLLPGTTITISPTGELKCWRAGANRMTVIL